MTNLSGSYVVISRLLHCYSECNSGTQNTVVSCARDSRDKKNQYVNKVRPKRTSLTPGEKSVLSPPLVLPEKIFLSPLHMKMGLMKNILKGTDKTSRGFEYVRNKFPNVSDAKIKEGVFIGSEIRN
jgi:hypothetical protein